MVSTMPGRITTPSAARTRAKASSRVIHGAKITATSPASRGRDSIHATGATLASVAYTFGDAPANTAVHSALLTFADSNADAKTPTVVFTGGNAVAFTCTAVEATGHTSTCTTAGADRTGVTSLAITVT